MPKKNNFQLINILKIIGRMLQSRCNADLVLSGNLPHTTLKTFFNSNQKMIVIKVVPNFMLISKTPSFPVSQSIWNGKNPVFGPFLHIIAINLNYLVVFSLENGENRGKTGSTGSRQIPLSQIYHAWSPLNIFCEISLPKKLISGGARWACSSGTCWRLPWPTLPWQDFQNGLKGSPHVWGRPWSPICAWQKK